MGPRPPPRQAAAPQPSRALVVATSLAVWLLLLTVAAHLNLAGDTARHVRVEEGRARPGGGQLRQQGRASAWLPMQMSAQLGARLSSAFALHGGPPGPDPAADAALGCGRLPDLGFDYPPLRPLRQQLGAVLCSDPPQQAVRAAYAAALSAHSSGAVQAAGAGSQVPADAAQGSDEALVQAFLGGALDIIAAAGQLLACGQDDASLLRAAGVGGGHAPPLEGKAYLLASNVHNSGHIMPNLILQTLQLALLFPSGSLAVSVYESGSNDLTRQWMSLLRMLLLPLRVPHVFTANGALRPRPGLSRIELLAALRNALVEPFVHVERAANASGARHRGPSGAGTGFRPDYVVVANDVYFCAQDVLRLAMHGSHIACGFDFYTAPWEAAADGLDGGGGSAPDDDVMVLGGHSATPGKGAELRRRRRLQQQRAQPWAPRRAALRFYDKWVARDISGAKLLNKPPFIDHPASQQALAAGQPVPAYCCWNGLAVLDARPFHAGLRFRQHQAGECAASECSLMCDDFHRLGYGSVIMDPAVRLAYDFKQAARLRASGQGAAGAAAEEAETAEAGAFVVDVAPVRQALGPVLPWAEVARASAGLVQGAAAVRGGGGGSGSGPDYGRVECCALRPGQDYVNFAADCRRVDVMAVNHSAAALGAARMNTPHTLPPKPMEA